jgi:hypothetical protein
MPYWKLFNHFVWGTKNRLPLIDSAFEPDLYRVIAAKAKLVGIARTVINHRAGIIGRVARQR